MPSTPIDGLLERQIAELPKTIESPHQRCGHQADDHIVGNGVDREGF